MLEYIAEGFLACLQWQSILNMILGCAFGIVIGALPGLGPMMGIALLLPFTFGMESVHGMLLLVGVYCGGIYGGSITAILIRTPGTAASAATVEDGFALSQQGRAFSALQMACTASVIGGLLSGIVLLFGSPQVARMALRFGPPEYFTLALFGLAIISRVSGTSILKGITMALLGILFTTIGMDPVQGVFRYSFGSLVMLSGINLISVIIGLFAVSEVLNQVFKGQATIKTEGSSLEDSFDFMEVWRTKWNILRSSLIGIVIGAVPGTGASISAFLAYSEARRTSKKPELFGHGSLEGIAASEAANNATCGGTLIPMMTLGIPGDATTAILLGGLLIHGLTPGPTLFTNHPNVVYPILIGFILLQFIMMFEGQLAIRFFARMTNIPLSILMPVVFNLCLIGTYACANTMNVVIVMAVFTAIGYIMPKLGYPTIPMLIAFVLGSITETSLRQSLVLSQGSLSIFFTRPISLLFLLMVFLSLFFTPIKNMLLRLIRRRSPGGQ